MDATSYLGRGWKLVREPGLRRFVLVPLLINIAVFAILSWLLFGALFSWMENWAFFDRFGSIWLVEKLQQILQFVVGAVLSVVLIYAFTLLANLIGAPFNSLLAERVEMHLTGKSPTTDPSMTFLVKSIPKTMRSEVSKLIYLALWSIPLLVLGFIPIVNLAAPFIVFAFGAWMFSLEYIDYPMGNHQMFFKQVKGELQQRRPMALGFGFMVAVFSIIPIVNLVIMPIAVAGATALYVEQIGEQPN
ncbi:UNVERIFIED_CONTAM: hypothetical protein GTU68_063828 [Idotea baltica]|nr:hypothetical protein [Idotea baltica]